MALKFVFLPAVALLLAAQSPVIRVDTRLVELNVIVRDQNNRPVEGLTKSDFTVFDRNKEQRIALFSADSVHRLAKPSAPLPAGIHTNRPDQRAESPTTITVVLLDAVNTRIEDQAFAKQQFIKFLSQIRPEDRVAVYALGNRLRILQDFTADPRALLNSIARYRGEPSAQVDGAEPDPANTGDKDMDQWLNNKNALLADNAVQNRVRATVGAMEAIANHIGRLPGRKNLVWITGSFPFTVGQLATESVANWNDLPDPNSGASSASGGASKTSSKMAAAALSAAYGDYGVDNNTLPGNAQPARENFKAFEADLSRATRALNDANIAVYPVDARGLLALPKIMTAQSAGIVKPSRVGSQSMPILSMAPPGINTMQMIAENTGGQAFYNDNDIQHAIRDAIDDSETTYTLGFYADANALDAQFHKLKVVVNRKHVEVRYRKGYMASAVGPSGANERDAVIRDAIWSPLDSVGISLAGQIERVQQPKPNGLRVTVSVEPSDLVFAEHNARHTVSVDFTFALLASDGRNLDTIHQSKTMDLDQKQFEELNKRFVIGKTLEPNSEVAQIKVILFDRASGRLGSLTLPVK
ncbi:MAG TPA: VWA domain-containing protein [Bryobacteraceae bacterium]|nr:VWA domain-containing protein [Bryobacteraceae bacterium]